MEEEQARDVAFAIIGEFEHLLERHNIKIQSGDREGTAEEACIYGSEHSEMEDAIVDILMHEDIVEKEHW